MYGNDADFYTLKGIVEAVLEGANVQKWDIAPETENPTFHPGRCAVIFKDGKELAILGEIHPSVLNSYGIGTKTYIARMDMQAMMAAQAPKNSIVLCRNIPQLLAI